jgi:predicted amidohydrolase
MTSDEFTASHESLTVAAVQLNSQADVSENLEQCAKLVQLSAERGAKVIVLPENFAFFGSEQDKRQIAETLGDRNAPIQNALAAIAKRSHVTLIAGGFPERSADPDRPFNTSAVFGATGEVISAYRKIHLFDVDLQDGTSLRESANTQYGTELITTAIAGFKFGLSICYDLRFPELYRGLVAQGADVLTVPAAFTLHTGKDHWHALLRARAIESQTYVVAAAQFGKHPNNRHTYGHSLVIDPWGSVIAQASDGPGITTATISRSYLTQVRQAVPCLMHRRL